MTFGIHGVYRAFLKISSADADSQSPPPAARLRDLWQIQDQHRKSDHDLNQLIHIHAAHASHTQQRLVELRFLPMRIAE